MPMKDRLLEVLAKISTTQLALESLRANSTGRALELLEIDLDANILALSRLAKELDAAERECVTSTLQQIRAYRRLHPRHVEADLGNVAHGLLVRSAHLARERATKILDEIK
jgi:hypothetical protein